MHARVLGYLLIEFLKRESFYGTTPCEKIERGIFGELEEPAGVHDAVFSLGKWYKDYFLQACAYDLFVNNSAPQITCSLETFYGRP